MEFENCMNVLHIGCPYYPYLGGSSTRLGKLVTECSLDKSIQLHIATPTSSENVEDDYPFATTARIPEINKYGFNIKLYRYIQKVKIDVVVLHNSRVLINWMIFYRFVFPNIKIICEIHSFRDDSHFKKSINAYLYKQCDKVVVLSQSSEQLLKNSYNIGHTEVVMNGCDKKDAGSKYTRKVYTPNKVDFAYIGSFHAWQGMITIAKAAKCLGEEFWQKNTLHLVGGGPALDDVKNILGKNFIENTNIIFHGWLKKSSIEIISNNIDFLLAPRPSCVATETVVPLKVFESITSGIPMICSPVGGLKEVLSKKEDGDLAFFTSNDSSESLAHTLGNLPSVDDYNKVVMNMLTARENLPTWKTSSEKYINLFKQLVKV